MSYGLSDDLYEAHKQLAAKRKEVSDLLSVLTLLLNDVEDNLDFGCPFEDPNNDFHESVMAARKALGRA